jgi:carbon storage regulator CsrA
MLVLSRKLTERIQIGDNVFITVVGIHGNRVRIGIDAPRDLRVLRSELLAAIPELSTGFALPVTASLES